MAAQTRGISVTAADRASGQTAHVQLYRKAYAVVIGIDRYPNLPPDRQLSYAVRDAKGVAATLAQNFAFDRIITLYDREATRAAILRVLTGDLADLDGEDSLFIFWAVHAYTSGTVEFGQLGFLIPHDGSFDKAELFDKNISMTTIRDGVAKIIQAKHIFLVVDACYSGLLLDERAAPRPPARDLAYLRSITTESVRQVLTAGTANETVLDGGPRGHSVFTGRFIEALEAARDFITAEEIGTEIKRKVFADARARSHVQTLQSGVLFGLGDYVFVPKASNGAGKTTATGASTAGDADDRHALFWKSIMYSDDPADFDDYLQEFPDAVYAGLARRRAKALREKKLALAVPPKPAVEFEPVEATYVVVKNANVRADPTVRSAKVATLKRGASVYVAGKVKGGNWYLVELDDKPLGYVFGELLMEREAATDASQPPAVLVDLAAPANAQDPEAEALNKRIDRLERLLTLSGAPSEVGRQAKGQEVEVLAKRLDRLERLLYLSGAPSKVRRPTSLAGAVAAVVPKVAPPPLVSLPPGPPRMRYDFARSLLKRARYDEAESAFRQFIAAHGEDPLAGNAQYWLAETFYVRGRYEESAKTYLDGYQKFPEGLKAPDNLLKLGVSLARLGDNAEACTAFDKLSKSFPDATQPIKQRAQRERARISCP